MPLVQRLIAVSVQCGVPEDDEIVFNIHLTNNATGLVWDVTYSFSQLATLDHDISFHCDNMKEIAFPQIDEAMMNKLASNKHYTGKLQDLNKYRTLIEAWIQKLISRVHLMPFVLYVFVEDWFCLPVGPDSEWTPGRALSSQELDKLSRIKRADNYAAAAEMTAASTAHSEDKTKQNKGFMKFLGFGKKGGDTADSGEKREKSKDGKSGHALPPTPEVFLLKLQVHRGQRGRNGKVEYDIQIDHAHKGRPYTVSRSYSVFRKLSVILSRVQAMTSPGGGAGEGSYPGPVGGGSSSAMPRSTSSASGDGKSKRRGQLTVTFPEPPLRCSFGLSLTEAHLSYRTRQLDSWLRDVICNYKYMQELERAAVRYFLDLDMSRAVDISIQDRLARGQVEAPRANVYVQTALREKDISEISEVKTERSGRSRGGPKLLGTDERIMMQESKSDNGRSGGKGGQMLWETSSMASSHCAGSEIGRAKLFHAKVRAGELTTEKLASLQSELKASNNNGATLIGGATRPKGSSPGSDSNNSNSAHGKKGDIVTTADQVRNKYLITNALSPQRSMTGETSATDSYGSPNRNGIASGDWGADGRLLDAGDRDSNDGSVIMDREMDEDSLMRIGMGDDGGAMGGKNKATTDQWVAREFNAKSSCTVS